MEKLIPMEVVKVGNKAIIVHENKKTKQKGCTIPFYSNINAGDKIKIFKIEE